MHTPLFTYVAQLRRALHPPPWLTPKAPHTNRHYTFLLSGILSAAQAGLSQTPVVRCDPPLLVSGITSTVDSVSFWISAGTPARVPPQITIALFLDNGGREDLVYAQPVVEASPDIPDGSVTVGSNPATVSGQPVEIGFLQPFPSGPVDSDVLLIVRPGSPPVAGIVPWSSVGNSGIGAPAIGQVVVPQNTPSSLWTIDHGLHAYPQVATIDSAGSLVEGDVRYPSTDRVTIQFGSAFSGLAILT